MKNRPFSIEWIARINSILNICVLNPLISFLIQCSILQIKKLK